jgi:hypothetical protein
MGVLVANPPASTRSTKPDAISATSRYATFLSQNEYATSLAKYATTTAVNHGPPGSDATSETSTSTTAMGFATARGTRPDAMGR